GRRRAERERLEQEAEPIAGLRLGHSEQREHALLHVRAVNPDAAAAELDAVQDQIVCRRAHGERLSLESLEVLIQRRRERMVDRDVAARAGIVLQEREIDHPEETILPARDAVEPLTELQAELREDGRCERLRLREQD